MKAEIKMWTMMVAIILTAIVSQIKYGNQGSLNLSAMLLFGAGYGWYAAKTREEDKLKEVKD